MKYIGLLLTFIVISFCQAQQLPRSLNKAPVYWPDWELELDDSTKITIIEKLFKTIEMEYGLKYYSYTVENILSSYHFLDYNRDGLMDIIYNGFAGLSNHGIMFFENRNGKYTKTLSFYGDIVEIFQTDIWAPLSFKIWNYRCCGNYVNFLETYGPVLTNNPRLKYSISNRLAFVQDTEIPYEFKTPRAFTVIKPGAGLRAHPTADTSTYRFLYTHQPTVDPVPQHQFFEHEGNIAARFKEETGGFVLNEMTDQFGKEWYFVAISSEPGMQDHVFCSKGDNNSYRYSVIGWMDADAVEVIEYREEIMQAPLIFFTF